MLVIKTDAPYLRPLPHKFRERGWHDRFSRNLMIKRERRFDRVAKGKNEATTGIVLENEIGAARIAQITGRKLAEELSARTMAEALA